MSFKNEEFFGRDLAEHYDKRWEKLGAILDALHLLMKVHFQGLPKDSNVLCVGAGTGAEILALAKEYPEWRFTALDTSSSMLDVFQRKAEQAGIAPRCDVHLGGVESLPADKLYDVATSILVSQFVVDTEQRIGFFKAINRHLRSGGALISADLARPTDILQDERLMASWVKMQTYSGQTEEKARMSTSGWGKAVSVLEPNEIEGIIKSAGFKDPVNVYKALFIHAWYAKAT